MIARTATGLGVTALVAAAGVAQTHWQMCGASADAHVVGPTTFVLAGPVAYRAADAGLHRVCFAPDAHGQPLPLQFEVPDGASVAIATAMAPRLPLQPVPLDGAHWRALAGDWSARTTGDAARGDYRIVAAFRTDDAATEFGIVARCGGEDRFYRLVCDRAARELRLERRLGGDVLALQRAPLPAWSAGEEHELALQLHGFRLQAFVDDAPLLQCFDGALTSGGFGLCHRGAAPAWSRCGIAEPVAPSASAAVVQEGRAVALYARAPVTPGNFHVLELALDRPFPALPEANGLEPWLLQRPAAPRILLGDWRGTLAAGVVGELGNDGAIAVEIELPRLPALRGRSALARWLLVSADGDELSARTPAVPIRF